MFNNLRELIATMPDEKTCREYLALQRWDNGKPVCPYCGCSHSYVIENGKRYKCSNKECYRKFSVTVGTIFEASNIPLTKWFMAVYLCTAHKKGISSYQLGRDIGVAQKSAWFMLHRIRELMKVKDPIVMQGIVEADETYMARKYGSEYKGTTPDPAIIPQDKKNMKKMGAVLGLAERSSGKMLVRSFDTNNAANIRPVIKNTVTPGSMLHTDESFLYRGGLEEYQHAAVFHSKREWSRNGVHTNTVENFWSVMKRGVYGIYHQISYKHLQRYCDEFSYRYNSRKIKDAARFTESLQQVEGRLDYKTLTGKR